MSSKTASTSVKSNHNSPVTDTQERTEQTSTTEKPVPSQSKKDHEALSINRSSPPSQGTHTPSGGFALSPTDRVEHHEYRAFPATPQYDHAFLDSAPLSPFFRSSPKVTPSRQFLDRRKKNTMMLAAPTEEKHDRADPSAYEGPDPSAADEDADKSSPPRDGTQRTNAKVTIISPPEIESPPHRRGPPVAGPYDLSVPDSPYGRAGAYPQPYGYYMYPPQGFQMLPNAPRNAMPEGYHYPYSPNPYGPRHSYEMESPSKRQRAEDDREEERHDGRYYMERGYPSASFDGSESGSKRMRGGPPPISKAPSYPSPGSPQRYTANADSSTASSYPSGARRGHGAPHGAGSDHSYNNRAILSPPYNQAHYEDGYGQEYYRDSMYPPRGPEFFGRPGEYPQEGHPLMEDEYLVSPGRVPMDGTPNSPPNSKNGSPSKAKASANAQAAIAAGMTEPQSAKEVDFDIRDPPTTPIVPAGTVPVCSQQSDINVQDVLCGRGGGTNTQIGNRRFRSLVQEFQPTYLLCRRKEKPLIARTIVLIIRKRGGRFLRKNEKDGAFYEVGDDKAEAKTSQALREGLDVRAARSTMDGKKKSRSRKKKSGKDDSGAGGSSTQAPPYHAEAPFGFYPYPPPYYNYGPPPGYPVEYYAPPQYAYQPSPSYASPSRKRRQPAGEMPPDYYPSSPQKGYGYPYPTEMAYRGGGYGPPHGEDGPVAPTGWDHEFTPPRTLKKEEME